MAQMEKVPDSLNCNTASRWLQPGGCSTTSFLHFQAAVVPGGPPTLAFQYIENSFNHQNATLHCHGAELSLNHVITMFSL